MEGFPHNLRHFFQGEYAILNDIYFDGGEQDIFRNCVDEMGGSIQRNQRRWDTEPRNSILNWGMKKKNWSVECLGTWVTRSV